MSSLLFLDEIYLEFRKKCVLIVLIGVQCTFTLFLGGGGGGRRICRFKKIGYFDESAYFRLRKFFKPSKFKSANLAHNNYPPPRKSKNMF